MIIDLRGAAIAAPDYNEWVKFIPFPRNRMRHTDVRRILAGVTLFAVAACSDTITGPANDDDETPAEVGADAGAAVGADVGIVGTWAMSTLNGGPLPHTRATPGGSVTTRFAAITFTAAGSYSVSWIFDYEYPAFGLAGRDTVTAAGTYERTGNTLALRGASGTRSTTTMTGNSMTEHDVSLTYVYVKQ